MTDNEIIKALEACQEKNHLVCNVCPLGRSRDCFERLAHNALWFIKRQKAEIERLKGENEGYKHLDTILRTAIDELTANIKAEAIRDFAKSLIDKSENGVICIADMPDLVRERIEGEK